MSQGQTTCTNCLRSSTECSFLDRQRFLTERESAILACMSQRNDITDLPRQDWITLESAAGTIGPPVNPGSDESPGDATLGDPSMAQHSPPTASRVNAESNMDPYSAIMTRFIEIFFRHHPHVFPFLDHSNTMNSYWNSSLPLQLANLIVLLALPYCSRGEVLNGVDLSASTTHCSEQAKIHISMHWDNPSLVMVKCLVLMAWYENSQGHTEVTGAYQRRAYEMAVALKLGDEAAIAGMSNNDQLVKVQLRALWNTVRAFA